MHRPASLQLTPEFACVDPSIRRMMGNGWFVLEPGLTEPSGPAARFGDELVVVARHLSEA